MNGSWKLSNYLFEWFMKKYGIAIFASSLLLGAINLLIVSDNGINGYGVPLGALRTYDLVIDYSFIPTIFRFGLIALFICIFIQANGFYTNGKGVYTLLTLPLKRRELFFSFFLSAWSVVCLYFAVWLIVLVLAYFPITRDFARTAAEMKIPVSADITLQGIDTTLHNGLFLAFQRSTFLSSDFPVSWIQVCTLLGGMMLSVVAAVAAGLYNQSRLIRILLLVGTWLGFYTAFRRGAGILTRQLRGIEFLEIPKSPIWGGVAFCLAFILAWAIIKKMKNRNHI